MPTLDLEILKPRPPGLSPVTSQVPGTPPNVPTSQTVCSQPSYNMAVEQGATLSTQITITITDANGVTTPVNITGYEFQFTAKTDPSLPDSDPSVVEVDWQETTTPTQGSTWLVLQASVTANMQLVAYYYQVRMVSPSGVVTPLVSGTITICQPISARY